MQFRKKLSKRDRDFLRMIDEEAKYIAETAGEDAAEPFITPVLFSLLDTLIFTNTLLAIQIGLMLSARLGS